MTWGSKSRHERGYGYRWTKLRDRAMKRDCHLCQPCKRKGHITPATEVDHVTPKSKGGDDHLSNLQAICRECHEAKTMGESAVKRRPRIGLDGWPE